MKIKIAVFLAPYGVEMASSTDLAAYGDATRISEWQEVEFAPLAKDEVLAGQIATLDRMAEQVRAEASDRLAIIERQKAELLALPAPEVV